MSTCLTRDCRTGAANSPRVVYRPPVRIIESAGAIELLAEVPGADENSTEVTLEDNTLTLRAKVLVQEPENARILYADHRAGDYERSFTISSDVDRTRIEARVKDGILHVRLPKPEQLQPQKIAVLAG